MSEIKIEINMLTYSATYYIDTINKIMLDKLLRSILPTMQKDTTLVAHVSPDYLPLLGDIIWYTSYNPLLRSRYGYGTYTINEINIIIFIEDLQLLYNYIKIREVTNTIDYKFYKYDTKITGQTGNIKLKLPRILL